MLEAFVAGVNALARLVIFTCIFLSCLALRRSAVAHEKILEVLKKETVNMDEIIKEWEKSNEWFQDAELDGLQIIKDENGNKQNSKPTGRSNKQKSA